MHQAAYEEERTSSTNVFLPDGFMFTSCFIFFNKGDPFSWNSETIPDSSDSCLMTSCRSSTRWDGVWGWRKSGNVCIREILFLLRNPLKLRALPKLTSILRGPYLISWAASVCLKGVGVLGELSRIDLLIAGVLKLNKKKKQVLKPKR